MKELNGKKTQQIFPVSLIPGSFRNIHVVIKPKGLKYPYPSTCSNSETYLNLIIKYTYIESDIGAWLMNTVKHRMSGH